MRLILPLFAGLLLAGCGQSTPPPSPAPEAQTLPAAAEAPWLICDGINAPTLLLFADGPADSRVRLVQYDKRTGATDFSREIETGLAEGAAGSIYTPLTENGADAGFVRQINPGMLENPGSAYTPPFTSVKYRDLDLTCRWLPRTRFMGFTGRRSIVISEDADGDLLYTTFDFASSTQLNPIDLSENGRSTTFSLEVRGGEESVGPQGAEFRFTGNDGFAYLVVANRDGQGRIGVTRNGQAVQSEPLIAFILGDAAE